MELAKIKACICEGAAEAAIIDVLLDNDLLIFQREEMLDEGVIRCRDGKTFETRYLRKGFNELISVIRILDSRRENFKLSKAYESKVDVINVITAPEIEMLIIFNEDKYNEFKKSGKKPSIFCKENLRMSSIHIYPKSDMAAGSVQLSQGVGGQKVKSVSYTHLTLPTMAVV